jgi:hypothetical protein
MLTKKEQRLRRARQTRIRIATQGVARLTVNRTNLHIYASVISGARNWVQLARAVTSQPHRSLVSAWLKKPKLPVSKKLHLTAQVLRTTAESRRWLMPHARLACSSKQIGNQYG